MKTKYFLLYILYATVSIFSATVVATERSTANIDHNLMLYLPFDGNLKDYSGHNRHGSALSSHKFVQTGKYAQGFQPGVGGIQISQGDLLHGLKAYSISVWVNVSSYEGNPVGAHYIYYDSSSSISSRFNNTVRLYYDYPTKPATNNISGSNNVMDAILLPKEWHHLAYVWDSENAFYKFYVDGLLFEQDTDLNQAELKSEPDEFFYIGGFDIDDSPFIGSLDEFKLFGRALSNTEIQNLAQQTQVSNNSDYETGYNAGIQAVLDNPNAFGIAGDALLFENLQLDLPSVNYLANKYKVIMQGDQELQFRVIQAEPR